MDNLRKYAWPIGGGVVGLVMLMGILRFALSEPATVPRDGDREAATRTLVPSGDAEDLVATRPEGDWVGALGVIEPATPERELGPAVGGRVDRVDVRQGDWVDQGTLLVALEADVERAALAAAQADVATAQLELTRTRGGVRTQDLTALSRDAEAARARADLSAATFGRLEATVASGGVSPDQLDRARRQAEQDGLAAAAAEARLQSAEDARPIDLRVAQARLDQARARRDQAQGQVALREVVAPIDGEVLEVLVDGGEFVQPGGVEPVVVIGDTRSLRARIDIDERDLASLASGARVIVVADAYPGRTFEGRVVSLGRRMGRKNVRTDEPTQRIDVKILEVVVDLGDVPELIVGQRVMAYVERRDAAEVAAAP